MVHKAATAYGMLKDHRTELAILGKLLEQTYWRKGKRATWYERRAIILEKYITPLDCEIIKNGILQALADEYTGLSTFSSLSSSCLSHPLPTVHRPSLARRLNRIQRKMKLHPEKWIRCDVALNSPSTVEFVAKRSDQKIGVRLDQNLRPMKGNVPVSDFFLPKPKETDSKDPEDPNVTVYQVVCVVFILGAPSIDPV
jgi:Fanconi-associated nuclease 1